LTNTLNEFDFTKMGTFDVKSPLRQLGFTWTQVDGTPEEFKDIKVEIRCFSDEANKGEFQTVEITAKPKSVQFVSVASCVDKLVTKAELRMTQMGTTSTSLMGVKVVQLTAFQ
jgi:hypothetical protein